MAAWRHSIVGRSQSRHDPAVTPGTQPSEVLVARCIHNIMDEQRQTMKFTLYGKRYTLSICPGRYEQGDGLAVDLIDEADGELFTVVSTNLGIPGLVADDEFVFKTYGNEGLLEAMLKAGFIEKTGREVEVGMAGPQPICRLLRKIT